MTERETAVALYGMIPADRESVRDADLARLCESYPELKPLMEEVQSWRDNEQG